MKGETAPHKVILLLSIISLIEDGKIQSNLIELSDELIEKYNEVWHEHVTSNVFKCVISTPFFHMGNEPFWTLKPREIFNKQNEYTVSSLRENFYGAEIDKELHILLSERESRSKLRSALYNSANMYDLELLREHGVYLDILQSRGLRSLRKDIPLWKLKLTEAEYEGLKQTLKLHANNLHKYGNEDALCYAEWWRRDYKGNIPSKEDVAVSIGLSYQFAEDLYMAARNALKTHGYT